MIQKRAFLNVSLQRVILGIDVVVLPATPCESPVTGAQPKILKKPEDLDLNVGEDALFELEIADNTGCNVSWSRDGQLMFSSGKIKMWNKHTSYFLQISSVQTDDESLYECRIRNDFGEVMCDVQLLVDGKFRYTEITYCVILSDKHNVGYMIVEIISTK